MQDTLKELSDIVVERIGITIGNKRYLIDRIPGMTIPVTVEE